MVTTVKSQLGFVYNDGGRADAGYKGHVGDCVARSIAIATGVPYKEVYRSLARINKAQGYRGTPRSGVHRNVYQAYLESLGWEWVPTMKIGSGCTVHLRADELPSGNIICRLSRHLVAIKDHEVHDTYDCTREGNRCVYGYFRKGV